MTGRGVLVTLTPIERQLIREAFNISLSTVKYSAAEKEQINNMLRRIPAPEPGDL